MRNFNSNSTQLVPHAICLQFLSISIGEWTSILASIVCSTVMIFLWTENIIIWLIEWCQDIKVDIKINKKSAETHEHNDEIKFVGMKGKYLVFAYSKLPKIIIKYKWSIGFNFEHIFLFKSSSILHSFINFAEEIVLKSKTQHIPMSVFKIWINKHTQKDLKSTDYD